MRIDYPQEQQLPALQRLWQEAFGDEASFIAAFFDTAFAADRCRCITEGDSPAAALYWFDCRCGGRPMAYIYAVATAKKHRGKGLCRTLMENTHSLLKELGYAGVVLVPGGPELGEMYTAMGYEYAGGIREFTCKATEPLPLRKLTAEEYAEARRQYLPEAGVLQEAENMAFLSRLAHFYAGEDFIVCAAPESKPLFCPELLGNAQAAPGITAALGAASGIFRTPGTEAFAMYHGLSEGCAPEYFAFAFD